MSADPVSGPRVRVIPGPEKQAPSARSGAPGAAAMPWANLRLPPFPQVALRVLQLAHQESVGLPRLCDLISTDPSFASEVLTIANSILYAPRYPSTSILQAVTVLGANTLQGMCITVGVRAYLGKIMNQPAMRAVWRHNLACAIIAERLAGLGIIDKDEAYTSGILHDIGRIGLAVLQPQPYAALLDSYHGPAEGILDQERDLFGQDHCETGKQLVSDWKLPGDFEPAVCEHHERRRTDGAWSLAELMKVACAMADASGFPAFAGVETTSYPELLDQLPARERRLFYADVAELSAMITERIHAVESY